MKGLAVSFPFSGAILVRAASVLPTAQVTYSHTVTSPTLTCHTGTLPTATLHWYLAYTNMSYCTWYFTF